MQMWRVETLKVCRKQRMDDCLFSFMSPMRVALRLGLALIARRPRFCKDDAAFLYTSFQEMRSQAYHAPCGRNSQPVPLLNLVGIRPVRGGV